jgi:hypothetical protein
MTPEKDAAIVIYSLFCVQFVLYGGVFFTLMWKDIQPVKARSKVLLIGNFSSVIVFM